VVEQQRMGKFQAYQVVTFRVSYVNGSGTQIAGGLGQVGGGNQGCTGNLEQNLRRERQRATDCYECTSGGNVQGRGKFQPFLFAVIAAANENGNGQRQTCPLATLGFQPSSVQTNPSRET